MIYSSAYIKRTVIAHFDKGEDLLESIKEIINEEKIKNGIIISGYGTFEKCRWHYITTTGLPPKDEFKAVSEPLELNSMHGVIANGEPHIHIGFSNSEQAFGGHLEPGCRVLYLADVVIGEIEGVDMSFEVDKETKLKGLRLKPAATKPGPAVNVDDKGNYKITGRTKGWER